MDIGIFGTYNSLGPSGAASYFLWCVAAITLHELAHGWAALWQGDDTPTREGRMTWNPMVHMGIYSLLCLALVGIAWGMMPTDPSKYRWGRQGRIVVSGAGPAMNIALAFLCWTGLGLVDGFAPDAERDSMAGKLAQFLFIGGRLNGMIALFNLLPLPPFDGASIVAGFSRTYYRWMHDPRIATAGFFIVLVAMFSGVAGICATAAVRVGNAWALGVEGVVLALTK
jgi:Zn-dependent protease